MNFISIQKRLALAGTIIAVTTMTACSTIQLPDQPSSIGKDAKMSLSPDGDARQFRVSGDLKISKVIVQTPTWPTADAVATQDERKDVIKKFESQLMSAIKPTSSNEGQTITVRSVIADGRTVSSGLNVLTTAFLFVPVDRGGAVIEMEATDQSGKIVAAMMYRYSGEIGEFSSNFSKTAQIQIATQRASDRFAKLLFGQ